MFNRYGMVQIIVIVTDKCKCCTYQYNNQFIWRKAKFIGLYSTVNTELVFENNKEIKNKKNTVNMEGVQYMTIGLGSPL